MSLRPHARIHLDHIVGNWHSLRAVHPARQAAAVVKADAYGHGLAQVSEALHDGGCQHFFVAHSFEGEDVRRAIGPHAVIYVLNGPEISEQRLYRHAALTPVVNTDQQFQTVVAWIGSGGALPRGYALKFDTGMNRLGLPWADAASLRDAVDSLPPCLILSHLACSGQADADMNRLQLDRFSEVVRHFPGIPASLPATDGIALGVDYQTQLARPGIGLYGGGVAPRGVTLRPGLTLEAPILQTRRVPAGETVGYGATVRLSRDTVIATVALGYADGFPRSASNSGYASLGGVACPILGRVSMDLITLDVSAAPDLAQPGVFAQFLGPEVPLEDQAKRAGTIGYELTAGLTPRVKRLYA